MFDVHSRIRAASHHGMPAAIAGRAQANALVARFGDGTAATCCGGGSREGARLRKRRTSGRALLLGGAIIVA
jgi:hypothetical protein